MELCKPMTVAAVSLIAAACSTQQPTSPPPELPEAGPDGEYQVRLPQPPPPEQATIHLELGAELDSCRIDAPKFFFDGTEPRPQDHARIKALADCLNHERFQDTHVLLVGQTDPRGSDDYNRQLGLERARSIEQHLIDAGVADERIEVQSTGESTAKGDQELYSYGYDRRVDVVQIGLVVRP